GGRVVVAVVLAELRVRVQVRGVGRPVVVDVDRRSAGARQVPPVRDTGDDPEQDQRVADQLRRRHRPVEPERVTQVDARPRAGGGHATAWLTGGWSAPSPRRPTTIGAMRLSPNTSG